MSIIQQATELRDQAISIVTDAYRDRITEAHQHGWRDVESRLRRQMAVDVEYACRPMNEIIRRQMMHEPIRMIIPIS